MRGESCQGRPQLTFIEDPCQVSQRLHNGNGNEAKRSSVELRSLLAFFCRRLTKTRFLESWMEQLTPPAIYSIVNYTMIHVFELPCFKGRQGAQSIAR